MKANPDEVSFDVSRDDSALIGKITDRAVLLFKIKRSQRINTEMDLTACHANGCPLKLQALLDADDFDFAHDIAGISHHLNRETGALTRCFRPRYAA